MKTVFAIAVLLFFSIGIAGCQSDDPDTPVETEIKVTPSATNTVASSPEPTPGVDAQATIETNAIVAQQQLESAGIYNEKYRPQFHFSPVRGWIGDPNGLIRYEDTYRIWWWGHAASKDLVHWEEQLPSAMAGDNGSFIYFSGSVVVDENNSSGFGDGAKPPMIALYTMFFNDIKPEVQGLSYSYDYANFIFYEGNPVLEAEPTFFRDPMVFWHEPTSRWVMAINLPELHQISFYASNNLKEWEHLSDFGPVGARNGWWEVADLYEIPVDGDPNNTRWIAQTGRGPNRVQYFIGDFDGTQFTLDPEANGYLLRGEGLAGDVFANFENGLPEGWVVEGEEIAVGAGDNLGFYRHSGSFGNGFLSTYTPDTTSGDRATVTVTSPRFTIEKSAINFLVSGGGHGEETAVNLIIDGEIVRTASGNNSTQMLWVGWDVTEYAGAEAIIQIVDGFTASDFGHINIDHILFSNTLMPTGAEHTNWLDYGADYYAVRTFRDYDKVENRTLSLGWMGNWEYANNVPTTWGKGALALPRELELRSYEGGLRLIQRPIPALEQLRQDEVRLSAIELTEERPLTEFTPALNTYELDITFRITDPEAQFGLHLAQSDEHAFTVGYDGRTTSLYINRMQGESSWVGEEFPKFLTAPLQPQADGTIRLRIFVDQSSVEIFANDGEVTMTSLMFPETDSTGITLFAEDGSVILDQLSAWELASIWHGFTE